MKLLNVCLYGHIYTIEYILQWSIPIEEAPHVASMEHGVVAAGGIRRLLRSVRRAAKWKQGDKAQ